MTAVEWPQSRVLVTGATGLVGSWLVSRLIKMGVYTVGFIRDLDPQSQLYRSGDYFKISAVAGCLEDFASVERAIVEHEIDLVFHLGAQTIVGAALKSPLNTFESNIRGSYNLLEACRVHSSQIKGVIVASSDKAYGECEHLPYSESMPPLGNHPYDVSKSCTDLIATTYHHTYNLPVVIARCGNIYGGGDLNWSRIVPGTIRSLTQGMAPVIRSDGKFLRDYVYVDDAVDAYLTFAEAILSEPARFGGHAYNFGPSQPKTVLEIVDAIAKLIGRQDLTPIIKNKARAEIRDQYLDSSKAARELNLRPKVDLESGLRDTIYWYSEFLLGTT